MTTTTNEQAGVAERNKAFVEAFQAEIMKENWEEAKKYLHPEVKVHFPIPGASVVPHDPDGVITMFKDSAAWFSFLKAEPKVWLADENHLFEVVELSFEHTGEFFGVPPTGKRFSINGMGAWRFQDGLIHDHWGQYDMASIPEKLGLEFPAAALPIPSADD
ncbi:ester cyclase [Sphaerisporangium sp. TRM90804]|uniref:ester cyclase n=1 Tax=Sphaerisporangium sp. TRM90804 TaxID=3031113 RepID=UPI002449F3CD|nr:ester cyclase [Sphaerisporangium sp. TRM90804]MDH2429200.1 ester cyclase [Sphaerisporangium sp. TRM90804]